MVHLPLFWLGRSFWLVVIGLLGSGKSRRQISMSKGLMAQVDDFCRYTGVTFSDFLSMAAALYLQVDPTTPDGCVMSDEDREEVMGWQADKESAGAAL